MMCSDRCSRSIMLTSLATTAVVSSMVEAFRSSSEKRSTATKLKLMLAYL